MSMRTKQIQEPKKKKRRKRISDEQAAYNLMDGKNYYSRWDHNYTFGIE